MILEDWYMRVATRDDAAAIVDIYAPYVRNTNVSFEYDVPSVAEYAKRIDAISARYPFLVACNAEGDIVGYCYAGAFKTRAAYDWAVECTIYLSPCAKGRGVSGQLYDWLEEILILQHITNANACIVEPNPSSERFHAKRGFKTVGHFTKCGYKLGKWQDMIWMEKTIAAHPEHPLPVVAFPHLDCSHIRPLRCHQGAPSAPVALP